MRKLFVIIIVINRQKVKIKKNVDRKSAEDKIGAEMSQKLQTDQLQIKEKPCVITSFLD